MSVYVIKTLLQKLIKYKKKIYVQLFTQDHENRRTDILALCDHELLIWNVTLQKELYGIKTPESNWRGDNVI